MSEIKDGGPAFPVPYHPEQQWENPAGMTLRDWFAGQALIGMIIASKVRPADMDARWVATCCGIQADEMLAERERKS